MRGTISWSSDTDHDTCIIASTNECRVSATSSNIVGEIWVISSALDKDMIDRLQAIQLFTTAHHQGWISNINDGVWSTFELVVLPSLGDIQAVGTIFSHRVQATANNFMDQSGPRIDKNNEFIKLLKPGNAVAVRICAQFAGWQNIARQCRLELILSKKGSGGSIISLNPLFIKNDTTRDISVRVTASGESTGDEIFYTISPGDARQWNRNALQVAFVQREDNGLMETMGVKPGSTYTIGLPRPIDPSPPVDLLQATGEVTSMGPDEVSPTKQFSAMFKLQALDRRPVTFVGSSTVALPFFEGSAIMKYAKVADLAGHHTFSGVVGNGHFSIKLDNGVYMTAEVTGGPSYSLEFGGTGHWGLAR